MIHQTKRRNGFPVNPEMNMKKKEVSGFQFLFKKKLDILKFFASFSPFFT